MRVHKLVGEVVRSIMAGSGAAPSAGTGTLEMSSGPSSLSKGRLGGEMGHVPSGALSVVSAGGAADWADSLSAADNNGE
jgi:hypothetical protein